MEYWNLDQSDKEHLWKTPRKYYTEWYKLNSFPQISITRQECPLSSLLFNLILDGNLVMCAYTHTHTLKVIHVGKK